jgi:ABC-2 type transport system permease protein
VTRLFAAEVLKLRTLRSTWGFALVALLFAGLVTAGNIGGTQAGERLDPHFQFRIALDGAFPASVLALLLGITLVTNEFRHGTIARTLLATPRRGRFVAVKLLTGAVVGGGLMVGMLVVIAVTAVIWLGALGVPLALGEAADGAWRALAAAVVAGILGAAIGGAVHSQVGALVGALVWMFVLEPICWVVLGLLHLDGVSDYLPAAALGSAVDSNGEGGLSWFRSIGMALVWAGVAAVLALLRTSRRDIT